MDDAGTIGTMAILMIFEFLLVHSGVFMALMPRKISLFVFVPFYGIFAIGLNFYVYDNLILLAYLLVVINRMRFAFTDVSDQIRIRVIRNSVSAAKCYILLLLPICFFANFIFELGLTEDYLTRSGYFDLQVGKGGMFIDMPHIPMFFGFLYYTIMALVKYYIIRNPAEMEMEPAEVQNGTGA